MDCLRLFCRLPQICWKSQSRLADEQMKSSRRKIGLSPGALEAS